NERDSSGKWQERYKKYTQQPESTKGVNHVESIPLHVKAHWSCQIPLLSAQLDLNILPKDEDEDLIILGQE
ncbi:hypothetical protein RFZ44_02860, partial [Acinetobacter sp. 163]|nr:hypothetical protein [Acinetobacter sp. 163]